MRRVAWVATGVLAVSAACTSGAVTTTAASDPTTVPTTTSSTTAAGPGLEIRPSAGRPGEPLVVCGQLAEGSPVRVIVSDPASGDRWPDGVGGWSTADEFGRWCWTGTIPRELWRVDPSGPAERRPIGAGAHEIRAESFGEPVGHGTLTVYGADGAEGPSQAPDDAHRDGIVAALAELPQSLRVESLVEVPADEGTWVLSVPAEAVREAVAPAGGRFGDWDGEDPGQVVDLYTYGEILLVDQAGTIVRAYPMPYAGPDWVYLTSQAVYAGNIGDGAYPDSTVVRIDRSTLLAEMMVVVPCPSCEAVGDLRWPDTWHRATAEQALRYHADLVRLGPGATGLEAACWKGRVVVDPEGIDEWLAEFEPVLPRLPAALGRDEVPWEQVGAGWYVVLYDSSTAYYTGPDDYRDGPVGLYLLDAEGRLYELAVWPADDRPFAIIDAVGTSALVVGGATGDDVEMEWVDLVTGERAVVFTAGYPEITRSEVQLSRLALPGGDAVTVYRSDGTTEWLERRSPRGETLAVLFEQPHVEVPSNLRWIDRYDGTSVLVFSRSGVVEVTPTGEALGNPWAPAEARCDPVRWWDDDTYLAVCYGLGPGSAPLDDYGNPHTYYGRLWLLETDGSAGSPLTSWPADPPYVGDYGYRDAWPAGSETLLQWSGDCGAFDVAILQPDGTGESLPMTLPSDWSRTVEMVDVVDDRITVIGWDGCGGWAGKLFSVGLAGNLVRDLIPTVGNVRGVFGVRGLATIYP